jgi:hypothetical protein
MTVLSNCHKQTFDETITEEHCSVLDHLRSVTALGWTGTAKAGGRVSFVVSVPYSSRAFPGSTTKEHESGVFFGLPVSLFRALFFPFHPPLYPPPCLCCSRPPPIRALSLLIPEKLERSTGHSPRRIRRLVMDDYRRTTDMTRICGMAAMSKALSPPNTPLSKPLG